MATTPTARREIAEELRQKIVTRQSGRCQYCAADLLTTGFHIDHRQPLCRGGSNHPNNLVAACPTCNLRKGGWLTARQYREWLEECRTAPAGTWSCRNKGHQKYTGTTRWVAISQFNKGDSWCKKCRSRYMAAYYLRRKARLCPTPQPQPVDWEEEIPW